MIEATRAGFVFAHDVAAFRLWRHSKPTREAAQSLSGQALETAIAIMAREHPEYVVVGGG